ncbi:MAG TPA: EAL domain-containing response regulator [Gammaproteobacteria bacterium]|nr:EAL domain-containing response regulator [Gammaproteobacteria bacterium]
MSADLLILESDPSGQAALAEYCAGRGFQPRVVSDFLQFTAGWQPGLKLICLSLPLASTDGIEAIRFLAEHRCKAGLVLTSDADPRVLSAASRLARARGLRVIGALSQPFSMAQIGALLLHPEPELDPETLVLSVQMARDDLRECLRQGLVKTWFQPKIDVRSLQFVAVEALVRLDHPDRGILRPSAFLALAEESGLIGELTETVVRETFLWGSRWYAEGLPVQVAVNISPLLLSDLDLPGKLARWAGDLYLPPERIILEVTETWLTEDATAALDTLTRLRLHGFQLSIDDFGTGYSTMTQLHEIPYGEMKLDQSFVRHAARDPEARAIVESSIELGHRLGMRVVAEGVERQEDWDLISELDCDEGQGYFLARPMQPEALAAWLTHWNASLS